MRRRQPIGQASAEYLSLLLVIGAVLTLTAVAVPGVGERVIETVRTGLCIVGGDVCRNSDAAAAGLQPCVTSERSRRQDTTVDLAVVRLGGHGEWQLALRSDGQAVVTRIEENEFGGTGGVGLTFSPADIEADASATLVAGYHGGKAWRFPSARSASAFLERAMRDASVQLAREPDLRWHAVGGHAGGQVGVAVADVARAGVEIGAGSAIGMRSEGARRTLTLDLGYDDPHFSAELPGFPVAPGPQRSWAAEVSWEGGTVRELALRAARADGERLQEYTARLDLSDPGNRAVAERLLRPGASTPDMSALAERIKTHGVVERDEYRVTERRHGFSIAAKLGIALGLSHHRIFSERRLVDALVWVRGGAPQRRFDCIGV